LVVQESLFSRPGPRSAAAVEQLARFLHPGAFSKEKL
jgi:ABC-type Fe3+-hydroxamate transport system substrate-binding protein